MSVLANSGVGIGLNSSATGTSGISFGRDQTIAGRQAAAFGVGNTTSNYSYVYRIRRTILDNPVLLLVNQMLLVLVNLL